MKNNQNNSGTLKLPQAIDFSLNQRIQFNSPRFNVEESAKLSTPNLKVNMLSASKIGFKSNQSSLQFNNQQLQQSQQTQLLTSQSPLQNQLQPSSIGSTSKILSLNQEQKRGFSAKKKEQEQSPNSISGYVQKFFQQQQQQHQPSSLSNQNEAIDISSLSKQPIRKQHVQAPYMIKKQSIGNFQTVDINLNSLSPSLNSINNQNLPLSRKASHRKTQSTLLNQQQPVSYSQSYQLSNFQKSKDFSAEEVFSDEKNVSKSTSGQEKIFNNISKNSSVSTNIPQLPLNFSSTLSLSSSLNQNKNQILLSNYITKVNKEDSNVKTNSVFQPASPYFDQQITNIQQSNTQNEKLSHGQANLNEHQTKSARSTPKHNFALEANQTPKQKPVELGYHPFSAKNSSTKKAFGQNILSNNLQTNQRGNRSSSGHISLNIKSQNQKGEVMIQKKLEQINTERVGAGKSYSFTQGQLQQVLANTNSNMIVQNSNTNSASAQSDQQQFFGNKLSSQQRKQNIGLSALQQSNQQPVIQNAHIIKKAKIEINRKKQASQSDLEKEETSNQSQGVNSQTERQQRKESQSNFNLQIQSNSNYKDKLVKQQQQLSLLVSQQKQEQIHDFEFDVKDKNDEKETQSCESENSSINNKNNLKNMNISSENVTPVNSNPNNSNKKHFVSKSYDKQHPEIQYYHHGLMKAFKTPYPMDQMSILFRQHFLQTCQGVLYSNLARPVNPKDLVTKKVQLGPRNPKYKKTLIFDMDETLIHCNESASTPSDVIIDVRFPTGEYIQAGINIRPYAIEILQELSEEFEIVIFTASHSCYAQAVIEYLDPHKKHVHHRFYRDQCIQTPQGVYIKDLRVFQDRQLNEIVLIDNAAYSFSFQVDNGIPIVPFYDNKSDTELLHLCSYLRNLHNANDVRAYNRQNLKMHLFNEPEGPQKVYENLYKKSL
ncbi:hypothetical protein ABPG72_002483 [Tetrahymena utriculariae]